MPSIYLAQNEENQRLAEAVGRLLPSVKIIVREPWITISSTVGIRIRRRRLEEELGAPLTDDAWRKAFERKVGEQLRYDGEEFELEEYFGGDT